MCSSNIVATLYSGKKVTFFELSKCNFLKFVSAQYLKKQPITTIVAKLMCPSYS